MEIKYPKISAKNYEKTWQRLEVLAREVEKAWKSKKTALELIKEAGK